MKKYRVWATSPHREELPERYLGEFWASSVYDIYTQTTIFLKSEQHEYISRVEEVAGESVYKE
jgi:hypothetical protein